MSSPNPFYLIGKPIADKYGRFKGRIVALEFDHGGEVKNIVYENGGVILSKPIDSVVIKNDGVIIYSKEMINAQKLFDRLSFLKLQVDALGKLKELSGVNNVYHELYENVSREFENISKEFQSVRKSLEKRKESILRRKNRLEELHYWLGVAREANAIDNKVYLDSYETIDREIVKLNNELEELEYAIYTLDSKLSEIESLLKNYSVEEASSIYVSEGGDGSNVEA